MTRSIRLTSGKMKISEVKITEQSIKEFWDEREAKYSMKEEDYNYLIFKFAGRSNDFKW